MAEINAEKTLEQITAMRERFVKGGAYDHDIEQIESWRKTLKRAMMKLDLKKNPGIKMLLAQSLDAIKTADELLTTDKQLNDKDRAIVFLKKEFHRDFLSFFSEAAVEAAAITATVDENAAPEDLSQDDEE